MSSDDRSRTDRDRWDAVAGSYVALVGGEADSFFRRLAPVLDEELGDPAGMDVWDLGCGHGWLAGILADAGARVTGVDGSVELIDAARRTYPDVEFDVRDLATEVPVEPDAYDAVVCHMVLMDLPALDPVVAAVARGLRPGGRFIFTVLHPAFFHQEPSPSGSPPPWSRSVAGYLEPAEWWIETFGGHRHYHRPLEQYVDALFRHGLLVRRLVEPSTLPNHERPEEQWSDYERWFATIPTMLAVSAVKPAT
ncbi:class I SAM-dependent methyltransferase [Krasilnikoviella flava]|uniref:Methyltransferase domain-containing protein n=1 Tax=Krasilnikoviella flava TaxID=526729 RepID=A0A1T5L7I1_9MICO|nr:class I SAM-dependent methyltransferase [Krasilnikoviella flava]SKC71903.1 Methyltransferase domain-containing protein [Krasilnikoviella flava]